jgi:hypothetical protein
MTIQAIVRNGQLELESPLDLPDGTVLTIPVPQSANQDDDTPEEIERWLRWYDSFEPVQMSDEERAAWDAARKQEREWELSQWEAQSQRLEKLFP